MQQQSGRRSRRRRSRPEPVSQNLTGWCTPDESDAESTDVPLEGLLDSLMHLLQEGDLSGTATLLDEQEDVIEYIRPCEDNAQEVADRVRKVMQCAFRLAQQRLPGAIEVLRRLARATRAYHKESAAAWSTADPY
jgi:hypothetical protein